ncbi:hypothetical protein MTR67_031833 [Solanum verrucosum]|uniref:Uncharacterized protein n=2 Tax=Solanum TaxID=4107 RepID=A0AAF0ZGW5_SOLVR|nr:hypothetical protein MTR67_031833 [Solanum verrucosum]
MLPDRWALLLKHWSTDEKFKKRSEIGKMARASEKGGSLHTGGTISQVTRKERMEKELGRPVAVPEMFKVTHIKKSTNPTEEERWIEPRAQETYDRYIRISQEYRSTLPLKSQDRPFTQEENENLWKQSAGEPIRGSVYRYPEKAYQKKKSWYCGSSSSSSDGGDRETITAMESKIAYLNVEHAVVAEREKKREEREKKRDEEIATAKEVENKRYAALQAQLTFLFESGNILPPCPASSDGSDQEGDENDKSDKESEVMRMVEVRMVSALCVTLRWCLSVGDGMGRCPYIAQRPKTSGTNPKREESSILGGFKLIVEVFEVLVEAWTLRRKTEQIGLKRTRNGILRIIEFNLRGSGGRGNGNAGRGMAHPGREFARQNDMAQCYAFPSKTEEESSDAMITCTILARKLVGQGCLAYLAHIRDVEFESASIESIPVVSKFREMFRTYSPSMCLNRDIYFCIYLEPGTYPISIPPYHMAPIELRELKTEIEERLDTSFIYPSASPWVAPVLFVKKKGQ